MQMNLDSLERSFEQALGTAGARALIQKVMRQANIPETKQEFTQAEFITICEALKREGGFIATTANILIARGKLSEWKQGADKIVLNPNGVIKKTI